MASETYKKRQKEAARKEKQLRKVARRMERKNEKVMNKSKTGGENLKIAEHTLRHGPTIL
jgi:hypothetical protein